jgi:hypothetical protein
LYINPDDAGRNSPFWKRISRTEALCAESSGAFVAVAGSGIHGAAVKFEPGCPYYLASGPYSFVSVQYFVYAGPIHGAAPSRSGGCRSSEPPRDSAAAQAEVALEPESEAGTESVRATLFNLEWFKVEDDDRVLGGVKVRFTDFLGRTLAGVKARLRHGQTWLDRGELREGLLHLDQLPHGAVEAEVEWEGTRLLLPVAWQRPPLVEETIPLFKLMEKDSA